MHWIVWFILMFLLIYGIHLLYKFASPNTIKQIVLDTNDNIVLIYLFFDGSTKEYIATKPVIKIEVKGTVMKLFENGKYIAKIYKNTLKEKKDWDLLINYFNNPKFDKTTIFGDKSDLDNKTNRPCEIKDNRNVKIFGKKQIITVIISMVLGIPLAAYLLYIQNGRFGKIEIIGLLVATIFLIILFVFSYKRFNR